MTLVDTSAWVERDRATGSKLDQRLGDLLGSSADTFVTEPVIMELMSGSNNPIDTRRLLIGAERLVFNTEMDFSAASAIYRICRENGHTPRGMVDCMIAAVAIREDVELLARDSDFEAIARHTPLKLVRT